MPTSSDPAPGFVHPFAATGFDRAADAYERGRPTYPAEAMTALLAAIGTAGEILDLGAGTGKLTRLLVAAGATVIALEPVEGMRRKLAEMLPSVRVLDGAAEAIPLPDGAVAAVVAGQAFHWFDGARALPEIHRVLRPGGRLAVIWNFRDKASDWTRHFWAILDRHAGDAPDHASGAWQRAFEAATLFALVEERTFRHEQLLDDADALVDLAASASYIASLDEATRASVLREVRALAETHPDLRGQRPIRLPYEACFYVYVARPT